MARAIVKALEAHAASGGIRRLYLLTATAQDFSQSTDIQLFHAAAIQTSTELASLCPASDTNASTEWCFSIQCFEEGSHMINAYNVLFLCTGNSARSILAEAILNGMRQRRFRAFSAGSHPRGTVSPYALEEIRKARLPTEGLRSKPWDEFAAPGAPELHFVFTVCDRAAGEVCPVWPGQPITAHWGVPDPAAVTGSEEQIRRAFLEAFTVLHRRISLLTCLRLESLNRLALETRVSEIGKTTS